MVQIAQSSEHHAFEQCLSLFGKQYNENKESYIKEIISNQDLIQTTELRNGNSKLAINNAKKLRELALTKLALIENDPKNKAKLEEHIRDVIFSSKQVKSLFPHSRFFHFNKNKTAVVFLNPLSSKNASPKIKRQKPLYLKIAESLNLGDIDKITINRGQRFTKPLISSKFLGNEYHFYLVASKPWIKLCGVSICGSVPKETNQKGESITIAIKSRDYLIQKNILISIKPPKSNHSPVVTQAKKTQNKSVTKAPLSLISDKKKNQIIKRKYVKKCIKRIKKISEGHVIINGEYISRTLVSDNKVISVSCSELKAAQYKYVIL